MTTAHRPTWAPAKGGEDQGGFKHYAPSQQVRVKDQGTSGPLKQRHGLSASSKKNKRKAAGVAEEDLAGLDAAGRARAKRAALRAALEARERAAARAERAAAFDVEKEQDLLLLEGAGTEAATTAAASKGKAPVAAALDLDADVQSDYGGSSDDDGEDEAGSDGGWARKNRAGATSSSDDDGGSDSDDDSDDDEAELLAELERIKAERAAAASAAAAEERAAAGAAARDEALGGNPLLSSDSGPVAGASSFEVQRRWDDDVVFKHRGGQAGAAGAGKNDGSRDFVNDTVRSQFHKRFLNRYIR